VELPYARLAGASLDEVLRPLFYEQYEVIYGHAHRHLGLEITTCRLTASGPRPQIELSRIEIQAGSAESAIKAHRPVYFAELGGHVTTPIFDRDLLKAGMTFDGPAVVEERDSTAVIGPGATVVVDQFSNLNATLHYQSIQTA
jgi:N-methylhydantoinase A